MPADPVTCLECRQHLATRRGLCKACYVRLGGLVRRRKATWAQLEAKGRCRPVTQSPWRKL